MTFVRRASATMAAASLALAGLLTVGAAAPAQAQTVEVTTASFTWGLSGYAQKGIFGPWTFQDLTGGASQLVGSVSGGAQTEYAVAAFPATSMPVSSPQKTPNAIRFSAGTGSADPATGAVDLDWTGSYTVNAYPAAFNAPDEIYSDPALTIGPDGSGSLTVAFTLGAGQDISGSPTPAQDFGRITLIDFPAASRATTGIDSFRLTPAYQGVTVAVPEDGSAQDTSCAGTWGSWPQQVITDLPASVRPHFYSTGCGGMQDNKPALPVDVDLGLSAVEPSVQVSQTTLLPDGAQQVTVSGTGFLPAAATGTRPPLAGRSAGTYIAFGRYADVWRPSVGAPSTARKNVQAALRWAVPAADMATVGGAAGGAVELRPDGSFSTTMTIDKAAADAVSATGTYGIYTYAGSGAVNAAYETATPITFAAAPPVVTPPVVTPPVGAPAVTPPAIADAKTMSTTTTRITKKVRATPRRKAGRAVVTVAGPGVTGSVTVVLRTVKGKKVRTLGPVALTGGRATLTLPRLARGTYVLHTAYAGTADVAGSTSTTRLKVR